MELKPCPFCGCDADFDEDIGDCITCANTEGGCGFYYNNDGGWSRDEFSALWNRRATAAPQPVTPVAEELKPPLEEVVAFLCGEKPLHGYWFGDAGEGMGPYWWREELRNAMARRATPSPEQSDRERARMFLSGLHIEGDDGINRGPIDPQSVLFSLASLLAEVRAEERERCEKVLSRQLEYIEAARALQRKLNGIFPNHRPLYHANGGLCREADYHKELKDLNHALDEVAAAIRGSR